MKVNQYLRNYMNEPISLRRAMRNIAVTAVLSVTLAIIVFPIYWTVATSFKTASKAQTAPPDFVPDPFTIEAYVTVFTGPIFDHLINSVVISVGATALAIAVGVPAGYAYASNPGKIGGENMAFWILSVRMLPPITPILPLFFIFNKLNMIDTYPVMMILYLTMNVPLVVWLMRSFFKDIPDALEEAALIDGYSRLGAFYKVMLPLVLPGLVSTTLLVWIFSWNEFQFALVFTRSTAKTFPVIIPEIIGPQNAAWHVVAATSIIAILPVAIIAMLMQKRLIRGLTLGAVKG